MKQSQLAAHPSPRGKIIVSKRLVSLLIALPISFFAQLDPSQFGLEAAAQGVSQPQTASQETFPLPATGALGPSGRWWQQPFSPQQRSSRKRSRNQKMRPDNSASDPIFLAAPSYDTGGVFSQSVVVADVNGDGKLDLLVANDFAGISNFGNGSVGVLLGNGDGTFQAAMSYGSGGDSASSITVADVNHDGKPDLVVVNRCPIDTCYGNGGSYNGLIGVLLGNGDGTFQAAVSYGSGGDSASSIVAADVNGDGKLDLLVANGSASGSGCESGGDCTGLVGVLLGNGDGTFQTAVSYGSGGDFASSIAVADVNDDGKPDLVVTNACSCTNPTVGVLLGNGHGIFQPAMTYTTGGDPLSVAVADVNDDGELDLLVATGVGVGVLLGNGDGTFQTAVTYSSGGFADSVVVEDVNRDGKLDLLVANNLTSSGASGTVGVLLGNGDGTFQTPVSYGSGGSGALFVAVGDVNGDGKSDVLVANDNGAGVLLGNGDGTFRAAITYGSGGYEATSEAVADVNGDGKPDLLVANYCADSNCANGTVGVLLANGDGTFQTAVSYPSGGYQTYAVAVADVNGDGNPDLLLANSCPSSSNCANGSVGVLLGNGDGTFQTAVSYGSGGAEDSSPFSLAVADVNGDGELDLLVANECTSTSNCAGTVGVLLGNGDGTFQTAVSYSSGGLQATSVSVADINGDGKLDLLVANYQATASAYGSVGVLLGNGDGTFQTALSYESGGYQTASVSVGDVNSDGKPDLLVANDCIDADCMSAYGSVGVILGNGDGTFRPATAVLTPSGGDYGALALADFNGDGKLDIASGASDTLLLGNGDGTFQEPLTLGAFGMGITIGDFNHDGKPDLAVGGVTILLNLAANFHYATTCVIASSLDPAQGGQSVTFSATVTPSFNAGAVTGSVTFYDGAILLGTGTITSGQAGFNISSLSGGAHSITASYSGDSNYLSSTSTALTENINTTTSTTLSSSPNPSSYGQSVTFTAVITPQYGGQASGTITFKDGATTLGSSVVSGNSANFVTSALTMGAHTITAVYSGDSNFGGSSALLNQTVNLPSTTVMLISSVNPSGLDQPVTFTATITPLIGGQVSGTVTFSDGNTTLGSSAVNDNTASLSTSSLAMGEHYITAIYSGDSNFSGNFSTLLQTVTNPITTTTLVSSINPSAQGKPVSFTATVMSAAGTPAGDVKFLDGATVLTILPLRSGAAKYTALNLPGGTNSVTAVYEGNSTYTGSTSAPLNQLVIATTTTTLASSPNPSVYGQGTIFTAAVTSSIGAPPDGETVTFKQGATMLGTGTLSGGAATFSDSTLTIGTKAITAVYAGDPNFAASKSNVDDQVISIATTTTALVSSQNPSNFGQPVTFTATVTPEYGRIPTGTVKFLNGTATLGTATLSGGVASYTTTKLARGTASITAVYNGSADFTTSTSSPVEQAVNQSSTTTTLTSSVNPSNYKQPVTFTADVAAQFGGTITGTVTFMNGSTTLKTATVVAGAAKYTTTTLPQGMDAITATYNGGTDFAGSSGSLTQTVN